MPESAAAALPDRYLEVRYEAMHEDPATEMRRVLEFLEADAGDAAVLVLAKTSAWMV